jgi:hypothetical protein
MARTSERPSVEPADDELTPELALVDPELAQRAREKLPTVQPQAVVERTVAPSPPVATRGRRVGRVLVVSIAVLGAVGAGLAVPAVLLEDRTTAPSPAAPLAVQTADPTEAGPGAATPASPAPLETQAGAGGNTAEAAAAGPRAFGWVPVARASHYHVAFFRGDQKIFETWPRRPPLVMKPRWTFEGRRFSLSPGEYRWVVRPGFGPRSAARYGKPIVDASLLIPR